MRWKVKRTEKQSEKNGNKNVRREVYDLTKEESHLTLKRENERELERWVFKNNNTNQKNNFSY